MPGPLRVAVAGVTGGLGHAIVTALLDTPEVEVVLLTRSSSSTTDFSHFTSRGAILKSVDYSSIPNLTSALEAVDTVICTIFASQPTINLIRASQAAGVRRFAPSDFSFSATASARIDAHEPKRKVWAELKSDCKLEYTSFRNGIFMDYFVCGAPKPRHEGPFRMFPFVVDVAAGKAVIPGTGEEKVTFTRVRDVGRFVAAAVKFEGRWPEELGMEGETMSYNEVVRDVEDVIGRKIEVVYLGKEEIGKALEEAREARDEIGVLVNQTFELLADGVGSVEPVLNRLAPQVNVSSVKDLLAEYWST